MKVLTVSMDRKLFEDGSAVLLRSLEYAAQMDEYHIIVFSLKKHSLQAKKINNLYIYPSNSFSRISFLFGAYLLGKKVITMHKLTQNDGVISVQDPLTIVGYLLAQKFKLPLQIQIHTDIFNPLFKNSLTTFSNFWYSGWINVPLTNFLIPRAQGIRVVSESVASSIKMKFPSITNKVSVLPIFVDKEKITLSPVTKNIHNDFPQFNFITFMASRLTKEKRIDVALCAFKKVVISCPEAGLVIAGEGPELGHLKHTVKALGLSHNVVFIGWKDDLISYYKTANIFLLTSEYEGYGMTLVEAAASGCPIVTTKVGLAATSLFVNGINSFVCEVGDVSAISSAVINLINDNSKRELFKHSMQDSIKSIIMSREDYVLQNVALLKQLIKND